MDKSKTPQWEVVVNVHSISLIMEKLPPFGYEALGSGPDLGTVSHYDSRHLLIIRQRERPIKSKVLVSFALANSVHLGLEYFTPFEFSNEHLFLFELRLRS